eukprot:13302655-Ditylum_brightwellii.AAC.2
MCKIFDCLAETHMTDNCNMKNLLSNLLDKHKKKQSKEAQKEKCQTMIRSSKKSLHKNQVGKEEP